MQHDVKLKVGDKFYGGWKSVRVKRSIERLTGKFSLTVTDRWSDQGTPWPIRPGDACQVLVDGEPIITGHVDDVGIDYDATQHSINVQGRDRTADLVDCSAPVGSVFVGQTLLQAARTLCAPFGIAVKAETDVGAAFPRFPAAPGDSVFMLLDQGARARAVLLTTDGLGHLVITRTSKERIPAIVKLGENVLSCSAGFSWKDRFSTYTITGQREPDGEYIRGEQAFHIEASAKDKFVSRHRPLILAEGLHGGLAEAQERADWERNVHFGRSQTLQYVVQGWYYAPGKLWPLNRLVRVRDENLAIDAERLIVAVAFRLDERGTFTELTLMPREAFAMIPLPIDNDNGNWDAI